MRHHIENPHSIVLSVLKTLATLALSALVLLGSNRLAAAESCVVPSGSPSPCTAGTRLTAAHFLVPREWVDAANAEKALNKNLKEALEGCARELEQRIADEDSGPDWSHVLAASGAAFAIGFAVGVIVMGAVR